MTTGLPLEAAAKALDERPGTLRRWVREGCPVVHRGGRGRGRAMRIDPDAVREWRGATAVDALALQLAADLPEALAAAVAQAFQQSTGPNKRSLAGPLSRCWALCTLATLDRLRQHCEAVPDVTAVPALIEQLRKIEKND